MSGLKPLLSRAFASTPSRVRAIQLGTVVLAVVFAVLASIGLSRRQGDLREARIAAANLLSVQEIRVAAVRADSLASQAYLLGGQEPAETRAAFSAQIDAATSGLVTVSEHLPEADGTILAGVSSKLSTYVGLVEQARANNRQGFPVGAAYQRQANALLTAEIVPAVREVEQRIRLTVNDRLDRAADDGVWLYLPGLALVGGLVAGGVFLTRTFRRTVNVPLVLAGVVTLLALIIGGRSLANSLTDAEDAVGNHLQAADFAAQARAAAFDARSQEALGLINRGNGAANEALWQQSSATVDTALSSACKSIGSAGGDDCSARSAYSGYVEQHTQMRGLDDGGDWDGAVAMSVGVPTPSPLTEAFDQLASATATITTTEAGSTLSRLGDALDGLGFVRALVFVLGIVAAGLVLRGYGQRLAEYR